MANTEKKVEINDGHYTEVLDRCYVLQGIIEVSLIEHPLIMENPEWKADAEKAQAIIGALYQKIGLQAS